MKDLYAIIGNPVAHSLSPRVHPLFAAATGQELSYERVLAPLDGFVETVRAFRASGARGCNITVPFKVEAFQLATTHSARALQAGAANTLRFENDSIYADNTDGVGLVNDLENNLDFNLVGSRILLLGAGGAARGVLGPLLARSPKCIVIVNRTAARADELVAGFGNAGPVSASTFAGLTDKQFDLIINSTSASLSNKSLPLPAGVFAENALAYEMLYGKGTTPFMALAQSAGARSADGLGMLVEQAAEAFLVWRGVRPTTAAVLAALRAETGAETGTK